MERYRRNCHRARVRRAVQIRPQTPQSVSQESVRTPKGPMRLSGTEHRHKASFPSKTRWMVAGCTLKVLATALIDFPCRTSSLASSCWSGRIFFGRPKVTPRALAASLPSLVRLMMRVCSNSAMPAKIVIASRPEGLVVSAQGSSSDCNPALLSVRCSAIRRSSEVERASRSSRVTTRMSPLRSGSISFSTLGRLRLAPES